MSGPAPRFSSRLPPPPSDNALALAWARRKAAGLELIDLADSNPTRVGASFPEAEFLAALEDGRNARYEPDPRGLSRVREAIAARLAREGAGGDFDPERIFCAASTSEGYSWLFKLLCDPGDAVAVPRPGYPLFDYLAGLEAARAVPYRLEYVHPEGWRVDLDSLEAALVSGGVRAIVIINPNNPTGSYVGGAEREAVVSLASRHGSALVVDEVFRPYALESAAAASFAFEERVPTFVLDGMSKLAGSPQLKLGWIALGGPSAWRADAAARLEVIADSYLSASAMAMNAAPTLLAGADRFVAGLRGRLARNLASLRASLEAPDSPFRVLTCHGGWTALVEAPRFEPEEDFALKLIEEDGVRVHPGHFFDLERDGVYALSLILEPERFDRGVALFRRRFGEAIG